MSKETKPRKPRSSTKKSTSELEAKIAELEAKLSQLSSQVKPSEIRATERQSETRSTAPPPPRPAASSPTYGTLPAGMAPPKPKEAPKASSSSVSSGEVAPAYATTSSTGYTGNKYYATRARLSYHPPDKQFKGESVATTQTSAPPPASEIQYTYQETTSGSQQKPKSSSWKARGAQAAEEYTPQIQPARHEETRPAPPPAPKPRPAASGPTHGTLPAGMAPPKPTISETVKQVSSTEQKPAGEVAPAYATTSSTGYTGNKYYATRARLSYHPPDKQFKGQTATAQTVQVAPQPPKPKRGTLPAGWKP